MDELGIDIGLFQEVETRVSRGGCNEDIAAIAGENRPYHLIAPSIIKNGGWYGNLIVSRYPVIRGIVHNLETIAQYEPRSCRCINTNTGRQAKNHRHAFIIIHIRTAL